MKLATFLCLVAALSYGQNPLARPDPFAPRGARLEAIGGRPPDLTALPPGCSFAARCSRQQPDCLQSVPPLTVQSDRRYACFHPLASVA